MRVRRPLVAAVASSLALLASWAFAPAASAEFGFSVFDVAYTNPDGSPATQAGAHPFAMTSKFKVNANDTYEREGEVFPNPDEELRDLIIEQVTGFVGDATAIPRCSTADFASNVTGDIAKTLCPPETVVGISATNLGESFGWYQQPVHNVEPPPGVQARLGFSVFGIRVTLDVGVKNSPDYNVVASLRNTSQILRVLGSYFQLWGVPGDPRHDSLRCAYGTPFVLFEEFEFQTSAPCGIDGGEAPFLTVPRSCVGPAATLYRARSWENPGSWIEGAAFTHDGGEPPVLEGFTGCGRLPFSPTISSKPTTASAESPTGLDFDLDFDQTNLLSADGLAQSEVKKAVVTLPKGVTVNPSIGEGLGFCSPADYERESLAVAEGRGCPNESKIGTVQVESPLIENTIDGSVYLAQQGDPATPQLENPFDSLIAFYIVVRSEQENILVKIPAKVEPDPKTGQLVTTVDDIPQLPFSHFNLHFREGKRSPLTTPPACGTYETVANLTPWSDPGKTLASISTFEITGGIDQGPCPPGGVPPFGPRFEAGSINNNAKSYSPFNMRLIRSDGEQDMTRFGSILPPGVLGKLAGVAKCADAAVEAARAKTGREEIASPSCPASSRIGRTLAGAGVGSALTYVPGEIYLAGPYKGAPLSVISITPAVAGPFDAGTVVVRIALDLNPVTAEVEVDGGSSDPIPHILKGIPLKVRDLRVYVDRNEFIVNPTSCDPSSAKATLFGGFLDVFSAADDVPVSLEARYQAANCRNLGFRPRLKLNLRGGVKRGDHPGLKAVLRTRPDDANIGGVVVTLPRSAFLDQAHIRTICTRVQYAARQCPPGSIYGHAKAITPLLDEPIEGPVILRSSNNKLPDLVIALRGIVDVDVSSRIDSSRGGIRNSFEVVPDAPVTEFTLTLQGGKKGLIVNSRNLCAGKTSRVRARFVGQNGKAVTLRPKLQPQCKRNRRR